MSFANAGTTYIVNAANPTTAFISQQHIGGHQQLQGLQQQPQQQQNVQRIIATNCMPLQQQQQLSQQNCQIIHQQQPPQQQQQQMHFSQQQQLQQQQQQPMQQQHQQKQECQIVSVGAATSHQQFGVSASSGEKPLVRGKTSPYGFFVKMCYEEHKKKYPTEVVQVTEISKKCSQKWKTMSDDEKKRFFELAQKDAERYQAEVAAYGGEDVLRKRKRMKKDPNAPKRALSAFFFFSNEKRPEVQQSHPNWKVGQIAQELGRNWKLMTELDRQIYDKRALDDKERYAEEMQRYRLETGKVLPASKQKFKQEDEEESTAAAAAATAAAADDSAQPNQLPMQLLEDQHVNV